MLTAGGRTKMAASHMELSISRTSRGSKLLSVDGLQHSNKTVAVKSSLLLPEAAGAYTYQNISKVTRNRLISWKVSENIIQLHESSLDFNLFGNFIEINVPGETLLPNIVFSENDDYLFILFATKSSIHQLLLKHPNQEKYGFILPTGMDVSLPSVFNNYEENCMTKQILLTQTCQSFDVVLNNAGDVCFGLKTDANTLLVANFTNEECVELKEAGVMQRLWTGLVPSFVRGDKSGLGVESILLHSFGDDVYAFTLCKDLKIRVWNINTQVCIATKDLLSLIPDKLDAETDIVGPLCLKKSSSSPTGQLIFAAHCCLQYSSQFIIMEAFKEQKDITIMHVSNFFSDFTSVQDICINSQYVWALWNTTDGDYMASYAPIEGGKDFERGWHAIHLKEENKNDVFIPMFQDAKEAYLEHLFAPSSFDQTSILKALKVFTKTINQGEEYLADELSDLTAIKESVVRILDLEVEENTINRDLSPTDLQDIQHQCWSKFYSFYQQCRQSNEKPLGIFVNESSDVALILRQNSFGQLYYNDWLDHLYLTDLNTCEGVQSFINDELDLQGDSISNDLLIMIQCLKTIPEQFSTDVILGIDHDLDGNEDVKTFLNCMANVLITNASEFEQLVGDSVERVDYLTQMEGRLKHIRNPQKAVEIIFTALESTEFASTSMLDQSDIESPRQDNSRQFLCSKHGVQVVTEILTKLSYHRMHLCRDLFILLKLMDKLSCKINLDLRIAKDFSSPTANTCYEMLRAYHAIYWSAKTPFQQIDQHILDSNLANLASLRLTEKSPSSKTARKIDDSDSCESPQSLLYCFVRDYGIQNSLKYLTETNLNAMKPGDYSTMEMTKLMVRACLNEIWVLNEASSDFPEYLAGHNQYTALSSYLHLCDQWCMVSRGTKDFLLAQSYLGNDQPEKALRYFISAARGISLEEPLLMNLLDDKDDENKQASLVQYFVKVMRLFEQFDYPQYVIQTATSAITIAKRDDPRVPMLWSVIFKYHLELEHYDEAYTAIIHNADKIRRNDCLRHFIITLCERLLYQEICSYPYVNLEDEVVSIIEARARTMDITVNKYYDLLYSYHIIKNDYRKAATTMYEQACRLRTEMHGLKSLQKQAKCYLASLTSLKLVDPKYAWIVRPRENTNFATNSTSLSQQPSQSPKRKQDGEEIYHSTLRKSKVKTVIVELCDMEKEYLLVLSRLKLEQYSKNENITLGPSLSATETIALLSQAGLFDTAFALAEKFKLPFKNIFEALAGKCANLVNAKISEFDDRWKWLTLNDINTTQLITARTAPQLSYSLLQSYLLKYQVGKSSLHMKAVSAKFLSLGCPLPSWLIKNYQEKGISQDVDVKNQYNNPAELLHLYLCYDMVSEATDLSIKYIDAVLGVGKEYLGLNTALHATTPPVWLPYTALDQLLQALRNDFENTTSAELCEKLQDKLDDYFSKVEMTSCDKIDYLHKRTTRML